MGVVLHNPTDTAVRDYPIENPQNKEVQLWAIYPGETLEFPDYAGNYLLAIYGFLQRIVTKDQLKREKEQADKLAQGKQFSQIKLAEDSVPADQVREAIGEDSFDQVRPEDSIVPSHMKPCPECEKSFLTDSALKMHYAKMHIPTLRS